MKVLESKLGKGAVGTMAGLYFLMQTATVLGNPNQNYVNYLNKDKASQTAVMEKSDISNYTSVKIALPEPGYNAEKPLQLAYASNISTRSDISDVAESEDVTKEEKKETKKKGGFWKVLLGIAAIVGIGYAISQANNGGSSSGGSGGGGS